MDARRRQSYHPEERPRRRHEEDILRGPPLGWIGIACTYLLILAANELKALGAIFQEQLSSLVHPLDNLSKSRLATFLSLLVNGYLLG